jgi:hypothetical protein
MSIVDELHATHPSEVVGVVTRALIEYLDEVSELAVADLDVAGMAAQIASRIRFGFHADDADPTPPHGIERPAMVVYGLDSEPHPSAYLRIVR